MDLHFLLTSEPEYSYRPGMIIIFRQVVRDVTTFTVHNILDGAEIKKFMLPSDEVIQPCIIKEQLLYNDQSGNSNLFDVRGRLVSII
jgi:hypothetical protein